MTVKVVMGDFVEMRAVKGEVEDILIMSAVHVVPQVIYSNLLVQKRDAGNHAAKGFQEGECRDRLGTCSASFTVLVSQACPYTFSFAIEANERAFSCVQRLRCGNGCREEGERAA